MSKAQVGKIVPRLKLPATGDQDIDLKTLRGNNVVLYFYPKDNTSGCTTESCDFKKLHLKFRRRKTIILGISRDSIASHERFKARYDFPFELLSDESEKACKLFDVIKEKNMYGGKFMGIQRSTFLIDPEGRLQREWRKVRVKEHAEQVLEAVKLL